MPDWEWGFGEVWVRLGTVSGCTTTTATSGSSVEPKLSPCERAERLLRENQSHAGLRHIEIKGGLTGMMYRLEATGCAMVSSALLYPTDPDRGFSFCVYSPEAARSLHPWQDEMLLMALYIQHDEKHFLETAVPEIGTFEARGVFVEACRKANATSKYLAGL